MKIKARKDIYFVLIIFSAVSLLVWFAALGFTNESANVPLVINLFNVVVILFLLSLFFSTHYYLDETVFKYRSGPFFGKIKIENINEVIVGKYLWVGMRPATAFGGLIIKYKGGSWGEIYISPENNEEFIDNLIKYNPNIKITRK